MTVAPVREAEPGAEEGEPARGRAALYGLLSRSFSFPEASLHAEILDGRWLFGLTSALGELPYGNPPPGGLKASATGWAWKAPEDYDHFQSEYIRLFEVGGRGGAPCPLYSGHYARDRLRTMEELIRFYNFFGLRIVPGTMPDHATVELEFMQCLSERDTVIPSPLARKAGEGSGVRAHGQAADRQSYLRAERDFLERHLSSWWPQLATKAKQQRPLPFYRSALRLASAFFAAETRYLSRQAEEWGER